MAAEKKIICEWRTHFGHHCLNTCNIAHKCYKKSTSEILHDFRWKKNNIRVHEEFHFRIFKQEASAIDQLDYLQ